MINVRTEFGYRYSPNRLQLSQTHAIRNLKECKIPCSCVKIFIKIFIFFLQQQSCLTYNIRYRRVALSLSGFIIHNLWTIRMLDVAKLIRRSLHKFVQFCNHISAQSLKKETRIHKIVNFNIVKKSISIYSKMFWIYWNLSCLERRFDCGASKMALDLLHLLRRENHRS